MTTTIDSGMKVWKKRLATILHHVSQADSTAQSVMQPYVRTERQKSGANSPVRADWHPNEACREWNGEETNDRSDDSEL